MFDKAAYMREYRRKKRLSMLSEGTQSGRSEIPVEPTVPSQTESQLTRVSISYVQSKFCSSRFDRRILLCETFRIQEATFDLVTGRGRRLNIEGRA